MLLKDLDEYFRRLLDIGALDKVDVSLNGIQVGRSAGPEDGGGQINRVAFAVDASLETFRRAVQEEAQALVVHHGLFWGTQLRVEGGHYDRLAFLIRNNLALYAIHLPLDIHPEVGNNYGIAGTLGLRNTEPFGQYRGIFIGVKGEFEKPKTLNEVSMLLFGNSQERYGLLPFGPEKIRTVGIVSGGGGQETEQAIRDGLDLYITGEAGHAVYHPCLEAGINVIAAGHYRSEVWGVKLLSERLARDRDVETVFIDVPTGL